MRERSAFNDSRNPRLDRGGICLETEIFSVEAERRRLETEPLSVETKIFWVETERGCLEAENLWFEAENRWFETEIPWFETREPLVRDKKSLLRDKNFLSRDKHFCENHKCLKLQRFLAQKFSKLRAAHPASTNYLAESSMIIRFDGVGQAIRVRERGFRFTNFDFD